MLARPPVRQDVTWTARDTIIYNLGIGLGSGAIAAPTLLPFVLEEQAAAFPTMISTLGGTPTRSLLRASDNVDFPRVLHGEEAIRLHRPLPAYGQLRASAHVHDIWDKGPSKGAVLQIVRGFHDEQDTCVAEIETTLILRGNGSFGGTDIGAPPRLSVPQRGADVVFTVPTRPDQALLYRLSGDRNPIHVDPDAAEAAGLDRPILMGLCSFGIAATTLVRAARCCPQHLRQFRARFTGMVFPGDELAVHCWREDDGEWHWQARVADKVVMDGGRAVFAEHPTRGCGEAQT
jgi:acyl dehydratase